MALISGLSPHNLSKLPPEAADMLLARGEWSYCAMEHSRIDAVVLAEPGAPFHHLALTLGRDQPNFSFRMDGRRQLGRTSPDSVTMIEAGAAGSSGWDATMESACLYFMDDALAQVLGLAATDVRHDVRTQLICHSPILARLVHALFMDVAAGQPHGALIGDAVFVALAAHVAPSQAQRSRASRGQREPWRVRNALAFIHAHLTDEMSIPRIADAAATSPYYLNRAFRLAIGCSIWQYVLRARAQYARVETHLEPEREGGGESDA